MLSLYVQSCLYGMDRGLSCNEKDPFFKRLDIESNDGQKSMRQKSCRDHVTDYCCVAREQNITDKQVYCVRAFCFAGCFAAGYITHVLLSKKCN